MLCVLKRSVLLILSLSILYLDHIFARINERRMFYLACSRDVCTKNYNEFDSVIVLSLLDD